MKDSSLDAPKAAQRRAKPMYFITRDRVVLSSAVQNMLRIVIASYFLAGAIGIIPGTDLTPLFAHFIPIDAARLAGGALVFALAYLVMIGVWLRGAALTLGILTFCSSYVKMLELGMASELGGFWRDLALIAALILTYAETDPRNYAKRTPVRRQAEPPTVVVPETPTAPPARSRRKPPEVRGSHLRQPVSVEELEDIFREEFEIARSN